MNSSLGGNRVELDLCIEIWRWPQTVRRQSASGVMRFFVIIRILDRQRALTRSIDTALRKQYRAIAAATAV